ncbi:glutathione S-transferase family protein [Halieaceae bacterium IMCC14734]|uniref:Glutathione S-transferase family protein n=1 Tax=Candidatus Litorirhabdus singularis TaxID=2518993 RepID=A0ABT3TKY5_9GAMM|nr:glutathione S-transferase family protein [Candidatus Litorirhabdus singularis]MCX2982905.1 glutathione S-transferase family protein [Candidatus Litorirhabdus singularis]
MITIHHSPLSRSMRVVWFCEEIGLEYRLETIEMFSDAMQQPEYLKVNPLGKVPAIDDDGFVLWETSAILQYLDAKYGGGQLIPPRDTQAGALAIQWLEYGENPLTVIMGEIAAHSGPMPEDRRIPALVERGQQIAPTLVQVVEKALGKQEWILGDSFSAADIMLVFGLMIADHLGYITADSQRVRAYLERAMARPAFQRALG